MAPRASHIPHAIERSALQKLIAVGPLPFSNCIPLEGEPWMQWWEKAG